MTAPADATVELCLPADWYDLLLDDDGGVDAVDERAAVDVLVQRAWPTCPVHLRDGLVELLVGYRRDMRAGGSVSHGIVSATTDEGVTVRWHVLTTVVPVPVDPEVDLSVVLAEHLRGSGPDDVHVEAYPTDMGLGVGLVALPEVKAPAQLQSLGLEARAPALRIGMAAAVACTPGAAHGLLVVGVAADPEQVQELAGLVAVVAGRSRLHLPPPTLQASSR